MEKRSADERDGRNERPPSPPQVVVTAGKREQRLERFNGAAAVAGEGALRDAGVNDTLALARTLPGLYTSYGANVMFPIITLRGMTSSQDFYNPALTVYVDGVPQLPVFAAQALAGVERMELLKGPHGTLYGKSALGGVLNVRMRTPGDAPYFSLRGTLSERGGRAAQAEAAGALAPAPGAAGPPVGSQRMGGARMHARPAGRVCALCRHPPAPGIRRCARAGRIPQLPHAPLWQQPGRAGAVRGARLAADGATAGNQRVRFERRFPIGAYHSSQPEHWQQNMQELRWATLGDGQAGSGRRWDAVPGLYRQRAQQQRSSQFTLATVPASMPATHSTGVSQTLAAYGDLTWHATPRMDVGAGLRLSRDESRTQFGGSAGASAFAGSAAQAHNTWQGRLNAGWQFSPQWRGYANLAQGYKPAGYNLAPSNPLDAQGFRRERATSYEAGARLTTARLQGNFALYRIRTRDVQLYTSEIGQQVLRNAGHARSSGVEGQIEWLLPHWRTGAASVGLGGFVNRSIYTEYFDAACAACIGKRVPHTPASGLKTSRSRGAFRRANTRCARAATHCWMPRCHGTPRPGWKCAHGRTTSPTKPCATTASPSAARRWRNWRQGARRGDAGIQLLKQAAKSPLLMPAHPPCAHCPASFAARPGGHLHQPDPADGAVVAALGPQIPVGAVGGAPAAARPPTGAALTPPAAGHAMDAGGAFAGAGRGRHGGRRTGAGADGRGLGGCGAAAGGPGGIGGRRGLRRLCHRPVTPPPARLGQRGAGRRQLRRGHAGQRRLFAGRAGAGGAAGTCRRGRSHRPVFAAHAGRAGAAAHLGARPIRGRAGCAGKRRLPLAPPKPAVCAAQAARAPGTAARGALHGGAAADDGAARPPAAGCGHGHVATGLAAGRIQPAGRAGAQSGWRWQRWRPCWPRWLHWPRPRLPTRRCCPG